MERDTRAALALAGAASVAFFVVYAWRLCPTVCLIGDSGELVTAAAVWGVPHAPGYPLFTALGHVASWLPLHTVAWRVHLTSAIFHALAIGAVVLATLTATKDRVAAIAAGCALGLQRSFFFGSLYAEVFPLNDLFFAALLCLSLRLREKEEPRVAVAFALTAGLASAHHMMIALAAPTLAWLAFPSLLASSRAPRRALTLAAAFFAPLVLGYALIPLAASREPAVSSGDVHDLGSFVALLGRADYGGLFSSVHGAGHGTGPERLAALGGLLGSGFGAATLVVAAAGLVDLARHDRTLGLSLLVAFVFTGPLFAWRNALGVGTEEALAFFERFTTMCTLPIAIAFGAGVAALARVARERPMQVAGAVALSGWAALALYRVRDVDLRDDARGIAFARDLVLSTPENALVLLSGDAPSNATLYLCIVEEACGDRLVLSPGGLFLPWAMTQTRRRHPELEIPWSSGPALKHTHELAAAAIAKRPVFVYPDLLEKDPLLGQAFAALPNALLFRLWPHATDQATEDAAFVANARSMAGLEPVQGDAPGRRRCEGCALPSPAMHPTQEMQLVHAYEASAFNHARAAMRIPEARVLIPLLLARAGTFGQAEGGSAASPSTAK